MALLFLRNPDGGVLSKRARIGSLTVDATLSENHTYSSTVPQYPVDSGYSISDDIIQNPIILRINGIVSSASPTGDVSIYRADDALQSMLDIYNNREPITIVTSVRTYENMAMTNLDIPRDSNSGESFFFNATFQQIILSDVEVVTIEKVRPATTAPNAQKQIAGQQYKGKVITSGSLTYDEAVDVWVTRYDDKLSTINEPFSPQDILAGGV